jgi:hypothetical protein
MSQQIIEFYILTALIAILFLMIGILGYVKGRSEDKDKK